jgi:hypothetical protein
MADNELGIPLCTSEADEANPRGIPKVIFLEKAEELCAKYKTEAVLAQFRTLHSKYRYMQQSLLAQRANLKAKVPDIKKGLETCAFLKEQNEQQKSTDITYQLCEIVHSTATVEPTGTVCLWLGANTMVEFPHEEALELLTKSQKAAEEKVAGIDLDLLFLSDQITTTEVNIARVHNHGVVERQKLREQGKLGPVETAPERPTPSRPAVAAAPPTPKVDHGLYTWKQAAEEVEVTTPVKGAKTDDIKVEILPESLVVEHLGKVVLKGTLAGRCSPNGSTWTISGNRVEVTLVKADDKNWPALFED